jgi:hypothetical protein
MHHIEILITEQNPGIIVILQAVAPRDVQGDLKFLPRPIKPDQLGTLGRIQLLAQRARRQGIESQTLINSLRRRCIDPAVDDASGSAPCVSNPGSSRRRARPESFRSGSFGSEGEGALSF